MTAGLAAGRGNALQHGILAEEIIRQMRHHADAECA
jgi:hypothetical protein